MNKGEREELRRLLRARFKVLRADVKAREAELQVELGHQIAAEYAARDRAYDDAMFRMQLIVDEANRQANDIGRELWTREVWGDKQDRRVIQATTIDKPGVRERQERRRAGEAEIVRRVRQALLELDRQENELLTELATSALESTEAKKFFAQLPVASELVPAYRLQEIAGVQES